MIKVLAKHIADKIAAGEVIDRPVSIIKELLENSIDAGADTITVEIKNGGKSYIRVTDSGCGINGDEVETAFKRHATSKITDVRDLDSIGTLGFRGEALASIAAVSRVELITRTEDAKMGRKVVIEGSETLENTGTGCPQGTTITVRDLFYNVPARRKFMGSDNAESRRITEMVSRIALSYSDIKFNLINGNKRVFSTQGKGNIFNSIVSIYGNETGRDLIPVEGMRDGFVLKGFTSAPNATVPSRNKEIFCVNGRVVSSIVLQESLEAAYREKLFGGRFPVSFLFLSMPPEKLDVNIHPTKKEIRFDDEFEVRDFVTETVAKALRTINAVPKVRREDIKQVREQAAIYSAETTSKPVETTKVSTPEPPRPITRAPEFKREPQGEQVNIKSILTTLRTQSESVKAMEAELEQEVEVVLEDKKSQNPFDFNDLRVLGAIFNTYILATDESSFYMIDQHAAHERIFYEQFMKQYAAEDKLSQQLLLPLNVGASAYAVSTEEQWIPIIKNAGYDIEFFGNNTYIVREVPAFMGLEEAESFLKDLLEEINDKPDLKNQRIIDRIITKSCKSAVKGGDLLKAEEIDALINQLKACDNPFSCPHGRPTFVRMTRYEIEKMFKRV